MSIKREEEFTKGDKYKQNLNLLTTRRVNILRRDHVLFVEGLRRVGSLPGRELSGFISCGIPAQQRACADHQRALPESERERCVEQCSGQRGR